jgi:hypothetical protein
MGRQPVGTVISAPPRLAGCLLSSQALSKRTSSAPPLRQGRDRLRAADSAFNHPPDPAQPGPSLFCECPHYASHYACLWYEPWSAAPSRETDSNENSRLEFLPNHDRTQARPGDGRHWGDIGSDLSYSFVFKYLSRSQRAHFRLGSIFGPGFAF